MYTVNPKRTNKITEPRVTGDNAQRRSNGNEKQTQSKRMQETIGKKNTNEQEGLLTLNVHGLKAPIQKKKKKQFLQEMLIK